MAGADDDAILDLAASEDRIIVSEDTDFGALLARAGSRAPSFVLIRSAEPITAGAQAEMLVANLPGLELELAEGAIVVFARGRTRVRPLPIRRAE